MSVSPFIPTIIITQEIQTELRGYTLVGREFELKSHVPVKDYAIAITGEKLFGDYWVITKEEYMRVVPEARNKDFDSKDVYIPTFVAKPSFRPCYIKATKV